MRNFFLLTLLSAVAIKSFGQTNPAALAPTATLRAVYLESNPAQAVKDAAATGEIRGVAPDVTRELARRLGVGVKLTGVQGPQNVIDAVQRGEADIGFVAYNPERTGTVEFSQTYMLVQQTFIVRENSSIRSVKDIDRPNQRIGGGRGDSIALYLARTLKQAQLVQVDSGLNEARQMVLAGTLDAMGANRQRLTDAARGVSGLRLLPDDLYGVEQSIIVPKEKPELLKAINQFLNDIRASIAFIETLSRKESYERQRTRNVCDPAFVLFKRGCLWASWIGRLGTARKPRTASERKGRRQASSRTSKDSAGECC